jgi:hypothetical protein
MWDETVLRAWVLRAKKGVFFLTERAQRHRAGKVFREVASEANRTVGLQVFMRKSGLKI